MTTTMLAKDKAGEKIEVLEWKIKVKLLAARHSH